MNRLNNNPNETFGESKKGYNRTINFEKVDEDFGLEDDEELYDPKDVLVEDENEHILWERRGGRGSSALKTLISRCRCQPLSWKLIVLVGLTVAVLIAITVSWIAPVSKSTSYTSAEASTSSSSDANIKENIQVVPKAAAEMESACSMNSNDSISNPAECQRHCSFGMCCLAHGGNNCFVRNHDTCPDYQVCSVLEVGKSPGFLGETLIPAPKSIHQHCSEKMITKNGDQMCELLCTPALCCIGDDGDCSSQKQACDTYRLCHNVWLSSVKDSSALPSPIETICESYPLPGGVVEEHNRGKASLCETTCREASCCFTGECLERNAVACAQYKACPSSLVGELRTQQVDIPKPQQPLKTLCSNSNLKTPEGLAECIKECSFGSCCFKGGGDYNCFAKNEETCRQYQPCFNVPDLVSSPVLQDPVEFLCSPEKVATDEGRAMCADVCQAAGCCLTEGVDNCYEFYEEFCDQYRFCSILIDVPEAPLDLFDICCSGDSPSSRCRSMCEKASCCFDDGPGSCLPFNEITCESYNICHDKLNPSSPHEASSPIAAVCSPFNLQSISGRIACRQECEPAQCCISEDRSCVNENQELCDLYVPFCTKLWSSDNANEEDDEIDSSSTIARICSSSNISTKAGRNQCEKECLPAACCDAKGEFNCFQDNQSWCTEFSRACKILEKP